MSITESIVDKRDNKLSELALCAPGTQFNLAGHAPLRASVDSICRRIYWVGILLRSRVVKGSNFPVHPC